MIQYCKKHQIKFMAECYGCKRELFKIQADNEKRKAMATEENPIRDRLTVTRELGGPGRVTIYWEQNRGTEGWVAHRLIPRQPHTRMPDLDAPNMLEVFKLMRDIAVGSIDDELLMA